MNGGISYGIFEWCRNVASRRNWAMETHTSHVSVVNCIFHMFNFATTQRLPFLFAFLYWVSWMNFCTLSASVVQRTSLLCEADSSKNDMPLQTFMDWYLRNIHFFYIRESIKYSRFHLLSCIFGDVIIFRGWYASITSFSSYSLAEKGPLLNQTGQFWDNVI